jgi:hypothetical protein
MIMPVDAHLGVLLEWLKPTDGRIYDRILQAESFPVSTATDPQLDNEKLVPMVESLGQAEETGDNASEARLRDEIEKILHVEVGRRYGLICEAIRRCRRFPASAAAEHIQREDRAQYDRHLTYVADPGNHLAAVLSGNAATGEFLSRELNADHVERLAIRSVSGTRSTARLAGDVLVGQVTSRRASKFGRTTTVQYEVRTSQDCAQYLTPNHIGVVVFHREQVTAVRKALGRQLRGVHVETANRFQGLERKVIIALHPLSGKVRPTEFAAEAGRMCVAISRHRAACIMVSRDGIREVLDRLVPDDGRFLGQIGDSFFDGWRAHSILCTALESRNAIVRP